MIWRNGRKTSSETRAQRSAIDHATLIWFRPANIDRGTCLSTTLKYLAAIRSIRVCDNPLHRTGQSDAKRLHQEFQQPNA